MGDFKVRPIRDKTDRSRMYQYAIKDIEAFENMWRDNAFVKYPIKIGAEQELCLADKNFNPSKSALTLLDSIDDSHYTNELGLFNLEINLDPIELSGKCFSITEEELLRLLKKGKQKARTIDEKIVMTGILPTISPEHLKFEYMTPIPRYETISKMLRDIRGDHFEIYLQGVDELIASLGSVLFEACNTSFQLHLQIKPQEFVDKFNWSQMIAGPVLSACTNSPILFGRELWAETRIALFKQSLDTRSSKNHLRKKLSRVYFGDNWLVDSPVNLWKNELMRFPLLLTSDNLKDSMKILNQGKIPNLRAIRLHNGTTYTWNRLCYGPGEKAHLRIECRYLPAGPSALDEISNFAFWVGLMNACPETWSNDIKNISFKDVKDNFVRSARNGLSTVINWYGKNIAAKSLLLDTLLPLAHQGLEKLNIDPLDIKKYLGVIEQRVRKEITGSEWLIKNFRSFSKKSNFSKQELVAQMIYYQDSNTPVHQWKINTQDKLVSKATTKHLDQTVGNLMSTDIYSVNEDVSIELAKKIMDWNNIHHLPVENLEGNLVDTITDGLLKKTVSHAKFASEIMIKNVYSVGRDTSIKTLQDMFTQHRISGLPVVYKQKLIGMITKNDIAN